MKTFQIISHLTTKIWFLPSFCCSSGLKLLPLVPSPSRVQNQFTWYSSSESYCPYSPFSTPLSLLPVFPAMSERIAEPAGCHNDQDGFADSSARQKIHVTLSHWIRPIKQVLQVHIAAWWLKGRGGSVEVYTSATPFMNQMRCAADAKQISLSACLGLDLCRCLTLFCEERAHAGYRGESRIYRGFRCERYTCGRSDPHPTPPILTFASVTLRDFTWTLGIQLNKLTAGNPSSSQLQRASLTAS